MSTQAVSAGTNDIDTAKREVARAERALSTRLHEASSVGQETLKRAAAVARPVLIGVAAVAGIFWIVKRVTRARRRSIFEAPAERSVLGEAVRAAALSMASVGARRLAEGFLVAHSPLQATSPGHAAPPQPES